MRYYDIMKNDIFEGEFKDEKNVRGYYISNGYVYPMTMIYDDIDIKEEVEEEVEYEVEGECICCAECWDDDNCVSVNKYCVNYVCKECKDDKDCDNEEMICYKNRCMNSKNVECRNDDNCDDGNRICSIDGECVIGCRNNDNCERNEVCNFEKWECVKGGCQNDDDCSKKDEKCRDFQCSINGCDSNFDCNSYDSVCINNQCQLIDQNTETCVNDNDCPNEYYCDYEYLVCISKIKNRRNAIISKRDIEIIPAVCTLYGIISLLVVSSSYSVVQNIAQQRLNEECTEKCSSHYYTLSVKSDVKKRKVKRKKSVKKTRRRDSFCKGICRWNERLTTASAIEYGKEYCHTLSYSEIVNVREKIEFFTSHGQSQRASPAHPLFYTSLSKYCRTHIYPYWYRYPASQKRMQMYAKCVADKRSIHCE